MNYFSGALLAASASAYINQGYGNASLGAQHGYGYGIGNGYKHGDMHNNQMAHQTPFQMGVQHTQSHIIGYDSVQPIDTAVWDLMVGFGLPYVTASAGNTMASVLYADTAGVLSGFIFDLNTRRKNYVMERMIEREMRLSDIHDDNLVKIQAPFTLQIDLLTEEKEDLNAAKTYAQADARDAFEDLLLRMERFLFDRQDALMIETDRVFAIIERALIDSKPVEDVVFAMRLDWLQGLYTSGTTAYFDKTVYDLKHYDTEFDLFTYDIGHGKGHGHLNQGVMSPHNNNSGMVKGEGIQGNDLETLRGAPGPVDGKTRRYDRQTLGGEDYAKGVAEGQRAGSFGYNQAAQMQVRGPQQRRRRGGRRAPRGSRPAGYGKQPAGYSRS